MERRTLIAVVLSFIVLYAYQAFFLPPAKKPAPASAANSAATTAASPSGAGAEAEAVAENASSPAPPAAPESALVVGDTTEHEIAIDTPVVRAIFTNRGARLKHWVLKNYRDSAGHDVDLVPQGVPDDQPLPFSLRVDEGGLTNHLNTALYQSSRGDQTGSAPAPVIFEFQDAAGVTARKEFRLDPTAYLVSFTASVKQGDQELNPFIQFGPGLGDLGPTRAPSFFSRSGATPPEAIYHDGKSVERVAFASVPGKPVHEGSFRFAGVDDHYFIAVAVNPAGGGRVEYRGIAVPAPGAPDQQRQLVLHTIRLSQPAKDLKYYIGPKSFDQLKAVDGELVRAINFGIFAWLAVPFLSALKWLYGFVGNYGWSIIILTILMNVVMAPLRHKSVISMRKMQALQPQLKAIQDRYAELKVTDPARQKMNTEVMNLYREKGVNPASGCIPMLLQFPFLFAFYSLLSQAIELRGAPFALWIHDLSLMDPFYVTPLLMGATMFWQQRITPTSADPAQQRMMMFMPVVFVAMFLTFPSGLAIYYFINNLWAIGQQYFTNWMYGPLTVQAARPPAERRVKSAGSGRTERAEKKT